MSASPTPRTTALPWAALAVLALGLVSIALLIGSDQLRRRAAAEDLALLGRVEEMRVSVALAHLWLEELVSGDHVEPALLDEHLDRIESLARELAAVQPRLSQRASELAVERQTALVVDQAATFRRLSEERRRGHGDDQNVGIGSAMDVEYDRVFQDLLAQTRRLEAIFERLRQEADERSRIVLLVIVLGWIALIAFATLALWSRERRQQRAELALRASQEQLLQAQKMEAVGRLAGGFAHDINNYLAAIRGHCELVRMKHANDRVAQKMDAAIRVGLKASALIERLLAFSRQQPVKPEVISINHTVESIERMMQRLIGEDIGLETVLAADLWHVEIDVPQLEQIIANLVVNARDAIKAQGERGAPRITLTTANHHAGGASDEVLLAVSDTGAGIPAEIRDKIFEPFFTTKGGSGNSGLGLATVYGIVTRAGGRVEVASEVGSGTTFKIFLPRCQRPLSPLAVEEERRLEERGGQERILVVDDNEDFRQSTQALLEALGYRVTATATGEEAVELSEQADEPFDLVLTDVVLPGLSGREVVERLSSPAIFISGYSDGVVARQGLVVERVPFLQKPFSAARLASLVRQVLDRADRSAVSATAEP